MSAMSFRELIQTHYVAKGIGLFAAKMTVCRESGVSMSALRNAYDGTRVAPETAEALIVWAQERHGVTLGYAELTAAPTRAVPDVGARVEAAMKALAKELGLMEGDVLRVEFQGGHDGRWHASVSNGLGSRGLVYGGDGTIALLVAKLTKKPDNDNGERVVINPALKGGVSAPES